MSAISDFVLACFDHVEALARAKDAESRVVAIARAIVPASGLSDGEVVAEAAKAVRSAAAALPKES